MTTDFIFKIMDQFAPPELHRAIWANCMEKNWYFGNQSIDFSPDIPFWKMDLEQAVSVNRLWLIAKEICEETVGHPLRVVRQNANGQTYGQNGRKHADDAREGCPTLLYYPMPQWNAEWEGETIFFNAQGDIVAGVLPLPNRAVLFDGRLPHAGRAPSRHCKGLRVTVALKLERA